MQFPKIKFRAGAFKISSLLAYLFLVGGLQIAWQASVPLLYVLYGGALVSIVVAFMSCLLTAYYFPGVLTRTPLRPMAHPLLEKGIIGLGAWFAHCFAFSVLSLYYFRFLEMQTQMSPRLEALAPGTIAQVFKESAFYFSLVPCFLYGLLGIGLAYVSVFFKKKPVLWEIFKVFFQKSQYQKFFRNMVCMPIELVQQGCFVLVSTFMALWVADTLSVFFQGESLFLKPLPLVFMSGLILLFLRKSNIQLVEWALHWKISIAKSLVIYWIIFIFCLFWFHLVANWLSAGMVAPADPAVALKSALAGFWTADILETRLRLLLFGWGCLWLPWMVSIAAQTAMGSSLIGALLKLVLVPCAIMGFSVTWMHSMPPKSLDVLAILAILYWLNQLWGKMYQVADIHRGALSTMGSAKPASGRQLSLKRWLLQMLSWLSTYLLGHLMMGWLLPQFMMTVGAIFIVAVALLFSVAWGLVVIRYGALKKYKEAFALAPSSSKMS